jgi:hypothetical protein
MSLILGRKKPPKIDTIQLDAAISESHEFNNQVTQFPVENGSTIADHVIRQPHVLTIEGFVTNSPVSLLGGALSSISGAVGSGTRTESNFTKLIELQNGKYNPTTKRFDRKTFDVVTGLTVYTDMVMVSITFPRNGQTGDALNFNAKLQSIQVSKSEVSKVSNVKSGVANQAQATAATGTQTAAAATLPQKSALLKIATPILGLSENP